MSIEDKISELNYKFQFVKNNKYFNYNQVYDLDVNKKTYKINEYDFLYSVSSDIARNVKPAFKDEKSVMNYEILNIDIEQMKKIVMIFYMQVNPELSNKVSYILSKTNFIKYDEKIPSDQQRSVANFEGIKFYYDNNLRSLVTLAHEVSHGISNLGDDLKIKDGKGVESFSEVESMLTEELFLNYLKNNHFVVKDENSEIRELNDNDINNFKLYRYNGVIQTSYRALDEIGIIRTLKENKINDINSNSLDIISQKFHIPVEKCISMINNIVDHYYPAGNKIHDYIGKKDYDLENGQHLSNEARFIYAECMLEKFNRMNLSNEQKLDFYKEYLSSAKDMHFQDILQLFNVDLINPHSFSEEFISNYNALVNGEIIQRENHKL